MVDYSPPPADLTKLNPIQRYMQKGNLERQDYVWLFIIVLAYFSARPYIEKVFKWLMAPKELWEGEAAQREYLESKAKVSPSEIRGEKGEKLLSIPEDDTTATGSNTNQSGAVVNRKSKVQFTAEKSEEEKLIDWDDEPSRRPTDGDKSDVKTWLDKWDKEEI